MREIKFRYIYINDETGDISKKVYTIDQISDGLSWLDGFTIVSIDEYTGLIDRNGVEIFESDLLSINHIKREGKPMIVQWRKVCDENNCYIGFPFDYLDTDKMSVIGNIYENPELLKGGEKND